jgi:hypothetical protein
LAVFEAETCEALANLASEGGDLVGESVVGRQFMTSADQFVSLLLQFLLAAEHFLVAGFEFGEFDRSHLIEVSNPTSLSLALLQTTF